MKLYLDTESVGLMGPTKLIQFSVDRGPVQFIRLFGPNGAKLETPDMQNLRLLFNLLASEDTTLVGWNVPHDLFHLYRVYHICINQRFGGQDEKIVEPFRCKTLDLYNHAMLKGPFRAFAFANRKGPRATAAVRRVPKVAQSHVVRAVLDRLNPIVPGDVSVSVHEVKGCKDLVTLTFNLSIKRLGLKAHAEHWGYPVIKLQDVWPLPQFDEKPWMLWWDERYAEVEEKCDEVLSDTSSPFYDYARMDVEYLHLADDQLSLPVPDYNDVAAAVVGYTRYHGFGVDGEVLRRTLDFYDVELRKLEEELKDINLMSWQSKVAALKKLNPLIQHANKSKLELVAKGNDAAAELARKMCRYGPAKQKVDQAHKVAESGRVHTSLRILGTATGRMAGEGSFNVQGIGKPEQSDKGPVGLRCAVQTAAVGDFHQFEIAIAAAAWGDKQLLKDLDDGIDVHLATMVECHPKIIGKMTYEEAKRAKKNENHPDHDLVNKCRTECKRMVFGILYGCTAQKIADVFSVGMEEANRILERFYGRYPGIKVFKTNIERQFCTADTLSWARDSVGGMRDSETDLTGYTRHWSFEKEVACIMWELGQRWPSTGILGVVTRQQTKGPQSIDNACRSAFLGSAIAVQQAVYRQAANMKIQTTGAVLCKQLMAEIWEKFRVPCLNVHDEIVFARCPWFDYGAVQAHCLDFCSRKKLLVPHIRFDLSEAQVWSDKE
jgi:hypothetical protein